MMKNIFLLTPFYSPNIGGVETHFDDLVSYLTNKNHNVYVLTYQPLASRVRGQSIEKKKNLTIRRIKWFGYNWFDFLEKIPFAVFLYLTPGLLFHAFLYLWKNKKTVDVIHTQGIIASFIGKILLYFFNIKSVASVHTVYDLDKKRTLGKIFTLILNSYDKVLVVSEGAKKELLLNGLKKEKTEIFTYWADQNRFVPQEKNKLKKELGWENKFTVLFVGRLIKIKGLDVLVEAAKKTNSKIHFAFITTGTKNDFISMVGGSISDNVNYIGKVDYSILNNYYAAADILAVPSQYSEGFARVNLEAMLCGTPVLASNRGCLPEIITSDVGELIEPSTSDKFAERIDYYYNNKEYLLKFSSKCAEVARIRFSDKNAELIEKAYYC